MADAFKEAWFPKGAPTKAEMEAVYWDLVERGDRHVCAAYGSDLDATEYGSGFPAASSSDPCVPCRV